MTMVLDGLGWPRGSTAEQVANMACDQAFMMPDRRHVQIMTRDFKTRKLGFNICKPSCVLPNKPGSLSFDLKATRAALHCETGPARVFWAQYSAGLSVEFWLNGEFIRRLPMSVALRCGVIAADSYPHYRFVTLDGCSPIEWAPEGFALQAELCRLEDTC